MIFSSLHIYIYIFILLLFIEHTLVCLHERRYISTSYNVISLSLTVFFFLLLLIVIHYSYVYIYYTILNNGFFFYISDSLRRFFFVCSLSFLQASLLLNNRERRQTITYRCLLLHIYRERDRYEKWQTDGAMHSALYYQFNLMLWLAACLSSDDIRSSNCLHITFSSEVPGKCIAIEKKRMNGC